MRVKVLLIEPEEDLRLGAKAIFELYGINADTASKIDKTALKYNAIISCSPIEGYDIKIINKPYTARELIDIVSRNI